MLTRSLLLCQLLILTASASAVESTAKPVPLSEARRELLAAGWEPRETFLKFVDGERENQWGDAGELYRAGIVEVVTCSGTGRNYCSFNYVRGKECLVLRAQGEFSPGKYEPSVIGRSFECPPKEELDGAPKHNAP